MNNELCVVLSALVSKQIDELSGLQLSQALYDYIRFMQVLPLPGGSYSYDLHACGLAGIYALNCIFDDYTTVGTK